MGAASFLHRQCRLMRSLLPPDPLLALPCAAVCLQVALPGLRFGQWEPLERHRRAGGRQRCGYLPVSAWELGLLCGSSFGGEASVGLSPDLRSPNLSLCSPASWGSGFLLLRISGLPQCPCLTVQQLHCLLTRSLRSGAGGTLPDPGSVILRSHLFVNISPLSCNISF